MQSKFFWRNIIWAMIILIMCSLPGNSLPKTSMIEIPYLDKMVHFGMFFIMGIFICSELHFQTRLTNWSIAIISFAIVTTYGGTIEILQHYFFVDRSGDLIDLLADMGGGIFAIILFPWMKKQKDSLLRSKPFNKISFLQKIL